MTDLGEGSAADINLSGQVVGVSGNQPVLLNNGPMVSLGVLAGHSKGRANAINDAGYIVGDNDYTGLVGAGVAVLWNPDGTMIDLNTLLPSDSEWFLRSATDINEIGQISGVGDYNGQAFSFLLTPIPEPSTFWQLLLGAGVLGLVGLRSCSKRVAKKLTINNC